MAVVFNPTKITDNLLFVALSEAIASNPGWELPIFLPTTADDPGNAMAQLAIELGADLVIAAGGDGTVRAVTTALSETKVPCGIVPIGTGNLLARNLGIPLELAPAVDVALTGEERDIDLARLVVDHKDDELLAFTGMAGIAFDAAMMSDTDERLKKVVGNVAYVVAFARQMSMRPRNVRVRVDDGPETRRKALLIMVGNTGQLQGGIQLFPDAKPDDGQLDVLLAAPTSLGKWARFVQGVLRRKPTPQIDYLAGAKVVITLDEPTVWEADGDTEGEGSHFEFSVVPKALRVMVPRV